MARYHKPALTNLTFACSTVQSALFVLFNFCFAEKRNWTFFLPSWVVCFNQLNYFSFLIFTLILKHKLALVFLLKLTKTTNPYFILHFKPHPCFKFLLVVKNHYHDPCCSPSPYSIVTRRPCLVKRWRPRVEGNADRKSVV